MIILFLITGIFIGIILNEKSYLLKISNYISNISLLILIVAMGMNLGNDKKIIENLTSIGFQAVIFAIMSIIFSILVLKLFNRILFSKDLINKSEAINKDKINSEDKNNYKMTMYIFISVFLGIIIGYYLLETRHQYFIDPIINYSLAILVFAIGLDIGSNKSVFKNFKILGFKIIFIPILVAIGSLLGSILSGLFFGLTLGESAAIGSGFGWYSLSSILISNLHSIELGSLAFLTNIFREILTILFLPILARYLNKFNKFLLIAPGGATTMDVTLPLIKEVGGDSLVIPAFLNGLVLSALVPFLVPLFLKI